MDGVLPYALGGGFFVVAATIFGVMMTAVTRLRANERAEERALERGEVPATRPAPEAAKAKSGPWSWGTVVLLVAVVVALVGLVVSQLIPSVPPLVVKVTAYQFGWRFDYYETVDPGSPDAQTLPGRSPAAAPLTVRPLGVTTTDRLSLPRDVPVVFLATSLDVIHRFSAPEFLVRRDVVPGQTTTIEVRPAHLGRFKIESDYLCGAGDGVMLAAVDVVEPRAFDAWLDQGRGAEGTSVVAP